MEVHVTDFLAPPELLAQLAEEATELAHAALKLRRVMDKRNPTPVCFEDALENLTEEMADVLLCMDQLNLTDAEEIEEIKSSKLDRWISRLLEARRGKHVRESAESGN